MNDQLSVKEAIEAAASSPKGALALVTGAASVGTAQQLDLITGWMARGSVAIGLITAGVVLAIQVLKLIRELREYRSGRKD